MKKESIMGSVELQKVAEKMNLKKSDFANWSFRKRSQCAGY